MIVVECVSVLMFIKVYSRILHNSTQLKSTQLNSTQLNSTQLNSHLVSFCQSLSSHLAEELLGDFLPKQQHAKAIHLERNLISQDLQLVKLSTIPSNSAAEASLLMNWRKRFAYERANPERLPGNYHAQRVRQAYKEGITILYNHPEVWQEWAAWESLGGALGGGSRAPWRCSS